MPISLKSLLLSDPNNRGTFSNGRHAAVHGENIFLDRAPGLLNQSPRSVIDQMLATTILRKAQEVRIIKTSSYDITADNSIGASGFNMASGDADQSVVALKIEVAMADQTVSGPVALRIRGNGHGASTASTTPEIDDTISFRPDFTQNRSRSIHTLYYFPGVDWNGGRLYTPMRLRYAAAATGFFPGIDIDWTSDPSGTVTVNYLTRGSSEVEDLFWTYSVHQGYVEGNAWNGSQIARLLNSAKAKGLVNFDAEQLPSITDHWSAYMDDVASRNT